MSMDKLIADVKELIQDEYVRAACKFGPTNNSDHESYAVLLEEMQEAEAEVAQAQVQLEKFWLLTKTDDSDMSKYSRLLEIKRRAMLAACELIQVAAMAEKAANTIRIRGEVGESS
jgi:hypothetical protein